MLHYFFFFLLSFSIFSLKATIACVHSVMLEFFLVIFFFLMPLCYSLKPYYTSSRYFSKSWCIYLISFPSNKGNVPILFRAFLKFFAQHNNGAVTFYSFLAYFTNTGFFFSCSWCASQIFTHYPDEGAS